MSSAWNPGVPLPPGTFIQDSGTRKGMTYTVMQKDGKDYRKYSDGTVVLVGPTVANQPSSSFNPIPNWAKQAMHAGDAGSGTTSPSPASPATPTATPPATPPPAVDPTPWLHDPSYVSGSLTGQQQHDLSSGNALYGVTSGLQDLGFTGDADPNDPFNLSNLRVDPTNPYSKAGLLKRHYDQTKAGNVNGLAARGQLYSGALQNAQNSAQEDYNQGFTDLTRTAQGVVHSGQAANQQAGINQNSTLQGLISNFLARQAPPTS